MNPFAAPVAILEPNLPTDVQTCMCMTLSLCLAPPNHDTIRDNTYTLLLMCVVLACHSSSRSLCVYLHIHECNSRHSRGHPLHMFTRNTHSFRSMGHEYLHRGQFILKFARFILELFGLSPQIWHARKAFSRFTQMDPGIL